MDPADGRRYRGLAGYLPERFGVNRNKEPSPWQSFLRRDGPWRRPSRREWLKGDLARAQLRRVSRAEDGRPLRFDFSGFYFAVGFEFRGELDLHDPADAGEASTPDGS